MEWSWEKIILVLFIFCSKQYDVRARLLPADGAKLHYRIIGFSAKLPKARKYTLEVALGNYNNADSFAKNISISRTGDKSVVVAEVPFFGKDYTWRYTYASGNMRAAKSALYHFSTVFIPDMDSNNTRLRVTKKAARYKDAIVLLDGNRAMYDMNGRPVWYMPTIDGLNNESLRDVRDMKLSPQGTITFLLNNIPYEINYNGEVLWKGPDDGRISGDTSEHYHHEFTRLNNGNYMVLGTELAKWKLPDSVSRTLLQDGRTIYDSTEHAWYMKLEFGTIIEYNANKEPVWTWRSVNYFRASDVQSKINGNLRSRDVHENSFFFDERSKIIYVSFRNISRILKVQYPQGNVINAYGDKYNNAGVAENKNNLFCNQHSVKRSSNGHLYLFNNNFCNKGAVPKIVIVEEPNDGKSDLKKIWEYDCPMEGGATFARVPFASGGNVLELADHDMFASVTNDVYADIFIVSADKKILWSAIPEKYNLVEVNWDPLFQYRASIITSRKEFNSLLWGKKQ